MYDQKPTWKRGLILALALLVVPLFAYGFAYLNLTEHTTKKIDKTRNVHLVDYRVFKYQWEATLFRPAAAIESFLSRRRVESVKYIPL